MAHKNHFDVIVIGVGSMGSATCFYLSKHGVKVCGLEQFSIPNELSSHTGQSRIIRKAYFEHPDYVPLLQRAYHNWNELEALTGKQFYFPTGLLYTGSAHHPVIGGVKYAASAFNIPLEILNTDQAKGRYPQVIFNEKDEILFEPDAGFLTPEKIIDAYAHLASGNGALIRPYSKIINWRRIGSLYEVVTSDVTYYADKLIFTSGAWTSQLLPQLIKHLKVTRQVLAWYDIHPKVDFESGTFPCWMMAEEGQQGVHYGFPVPDKNIFNEPLGFKMALHYPGAETNPDSMDRKPKADDENLVRSFLNRHFKYNDASLIQMKTCMYTNTPDENFIVDFLPAFEKKIVVAAGFSGHGFKFASVIGEILADMTLYGKTSLPIEFLRADRFQ